MAKFYLREAINAANSVADANTIKFNIPGPLGANDYTSITTAVHRETGNC